METDDSTGGAKSPLNETSTSLSKEASTLGAAPTTPVPPATAPIAKTPRVPPVTLPEVDIYLHLLVLLFAIDRKKYKQATELAEKIMEKITSQNRRSLDIIAAKCYFFYGRVYELTDKLDQ